MTDAIVNAWIFLEEDEPKGTNYKSSGSSYQNLVTNRVYDYLDTISICWVNTIAVSGGHSIALQVSKHPGGSSNLQYMQWLIADARSINPDIKILVMLGYGDTEISQIFSGNQSGWAAQAQTYAENIVSYLEQYGLDGLDVDWEENFCSTTTQQQYAIAFGAIGQAFASHDPPFVLTIAPAPVGNMDPDTTNQYFRYVCPQYYGPISQQDLVDAGINNNILGYGTKFEPSGGQINETAQSAYSELTAAAYPSITVWRLNSTNFQYEQAQVMILYQLVNGASWPYFDDAPIISAAGQPPLRELVIRSGDVLNALQATNVGSFDDQPVTYTLVQHGGDSGTASTITLDDGELITTVSGYTGLWFKNQVVSQITFETSAGNTYGPYGNLVDDATTTPFTFAAPTGQSIVAFNGTTLRVPLYDAGDTVIISTLGVAYG